MNILPKKSWHVRNKDNIARVRRDEENARLEEEKLAKRAALAEQEARTKLLRDRVKNNSPSTSIESAVSPSVVSIDKTGHVNLFHREETGSGGTTTNAEYEAEKKTEQEGKEKALGVLKYLGQIRNEDPQPWYIQKNKKEESKSQSSQDVDKKKKMDPLMKMNTFLEQAKKSEEQKKRKKEKKRNKKSKSGKKTMEDLRAERLQREKEERFRADKLIKEKKEGQSSKVDDDPYKDGYYSQYNPNLAKKPKWSRHQQY